MIVLWPLLLLITMFVILGAPDDPRQGRGCGWFWAWTAAGALFMFSFLSGFSIGIFLLPIAAASLLTIARKSPHAAERSGFAAGIGAVLLLIAYLNRTGGHGEDPMPWLLGGVVLTGTAIGAYALFGHARERAVQERGAR